MPALASGAAQSLGNNDNAHAGRQSMSQELLQTLDTFQDLASSLFASLGSAALPQAARGLSSTGSSANVNPAELLGLLSSVDAQLAEQLERARQHQANQRRIRALVERAQEKDRIFVDVVGKLDGMRRDLDVLLKDANEEKERIEVAERATTSFDALLTYAYRLAKYTSAPPGFAVPKAPSQEANASSAAAPEAPKAAPAAMHDPPMPSMPAEPPFPTEAVLRRGVLNMAAFPVSGPAEGKADAQQGAAEAAVEQQAAAAVANACAHRPPGQQAEEEDVEDAFDLDLNPDFD